MYRLPRYGKSTDRQLGVRHFCLRTDESDSSGKVQQQYEHSDCQ